ncbi:MAG: nitrogen regulation protein NR(I) [Hyphomicrobiaceae bacterium]|nr:nitrogen regulation protein NR(I) [Hyphomicrobiaceae bacterium]
MSKGHVLIADDDAAIRMVLQRALVQAGFEIQITSNATTLWQWISRGEGDVVVTDVVMPDENIFNLIPRMKKARPELPIIVMSAQNTLVTAITAAELGAYEYLPKPFDLNELVAVVNRAMSQTKTDVTPSQPARDELDVPLVGRSPAMQEVYRILARLTQTDLTVLIHGESGTGKELVARALHDYSKRKKGGYVALNMAAIPKELIESELFGHEKGAFTGATTRNSGRFEQARGGTLFLDEIGDMPMDAQTRLLRVLQEGEYMTVGGRTPIKTDVRVIAATHRDLRGLISQGLFREDLFYRLNVVPLSLPPLRERKEDIPDLVNHFLRLMEKEEGGQSRVLTSGAIERLQAHDWPGNVRELENLIRRVVVLYAQDQINEELIAQEFVSQDLDQQKADIDNFDVSQAIEHYLVGYFRGYGNSLPPPGLYQRVLHEMEKPLLSACLAATKGNQLRAAELLGLNRNTLRDKIRKLDIRVIRTSE